MADAGIFAPVGNPKRGFHPGRNGFFDQAWMAAFAAMTDEDEGIFAPVGNPKKGYHSGRNGFFDQAWMAAFAAMTDEVDWLSACASVTGWAWMPGATPATRAGMTVWNGGRIGPSVMGFDPPAWPLREVGRRSNPSFSAADQAKNGLLRFARNDGRGLTVSQSARTWYYLTSRGSNHDQMGL